MGRSSEDTRLRILSAAERQFAQSGYDATGVAELCRSAGVSKGAFYHHFASKLDLFLQLLDIWLATLDAAFAAAAEQADDVPTALRGMAELVAEGIRRPEQRLGMFVEFWAHAQRDPAIWRRAAEPYRRYLAYFERLIARGIAAAQVPSDRAGEGRHPSDVEGAWIADAGDLRSGRSDRPGCSGGLPTARGEARKALRCLRGCEDRRPEIPRDGGGGSEGEFRDRHQQRVFGNRAPSAG